MPTGFAKIIALLRRTGDRCIVVDEQGNPSFVVLPLEEYQELAERRLTSPLPPTPSGAAAPPPAAVQPGGGRAETSPVGEAPSGEPLETTDRYYFEPIE